MNVIKNGFASLKFDNFTGENSKFSLDVEILEGDIKYYIDNNPTTKSMPAITTAVTQSEHIREIIKISQRK